MQLKPQTYYRTRDGRKAFVACKSPFSDEDAWPGWTEDGRHYTWLGNGLACGTNPTPRDLIAIWTLRPKDEPGWEIVEDGIVGPGWQCHSMFSGWETVLPMSDAFGKTVNECASLCGYWIWFRRPIPKPEPREWWEWRGSKGKCSGDFDSEALARSVAHGYHGCRLYHVREVPT